MEYQRVSELIVESRKIHKPFPEFTIHSVKPDPNTPTGGLGEPIRGRSSTSTRFKKITY
jgi:hypothetical protein